MTFSTGDAPPNVEHATAASAVRAEKPLAAATEVAVGFGKSDALVYLTPPSMDRNDDVVAVAFDPGVESLVWAGVSDRHSAAARVQPGIGDILDA